MLSERQQQILDLLLKADCGLSIDEMAVQMAISRNAVKQHLVLLEKQQLVQEADLNSTGGRPARRYRLTEQGINRFPKQYSWFCGLLLNELAAEWGQQALERRMWQLGEKLAHSLKPQFAGKDLQQKLQTLAELMQSLGYHADADLSDGQISLKALNCVYHDLAQQHPELCQFDQALISTLLELPIEQTACMAKQDCDCRFKLKCGQ